MRSGGTDPLEQFEWVGVVACGRRIKLRASMHRRVSWPDVMVIALVVLGLGGCGAADRVAAQSRSLTTAAARASGGRGCPRAVRPLGMIALAGSRGVVLVDLANCRERTLAHGAATDVRFSPDGRWVAYSWPVTSGLRGPLVVSVHGGPAHFPLGSGVLAWEWAQRGELLYGITSSGSLVVGSPTGTRRVVAADLGTLLEGGIGISPNGQLATVGSCGPSALGELDTINLSTGARRLAVRHAEDSVTFAGFSPDARWLLFWSVYQCSSSVAADGSPLYAVPVTGGKTVRAISHMLLFDDFLSWCGRELIAAAGPDRETQTGSAVVETGPPSWRHHTIKPARTLSWVSPSCAPSGTELAAAAGPNNAPTTFGLEHRAIWLLNTNGTPIRRLTNPPSQTLSDEAPRFSRDGRWIMFIRTHVVLFEHPGGISHDTIELVSAQSGSAIPIINFTSSDLSYYDHFDWAHEIDWHQTR